MRASWTDERLDEFGRRIDERFDRIEGRLDRMDARFDSLHNLLVHGMIGLSAAMITGFVAVFTLIATKL